MTFCRRMLIHAGRRSEGRISKKTMIMAIVQERSPSGRWPVRTAKWFREEKHVRRCFLSLLHGPDPYGLLHGNDEDPPVTGVPRLGEPSDRGYHAVQVLVVDDHLDLHLLDLVDDELADPGSELESHLLPAPGHMGYRHAADTDVLQSVLDALQTLGPDYSHHHLHPITSHDIRRLTVLYGIGTDHLLALGHGRTLAGPLHHDVDHLHYDERHDEAVHQRDEDRSDLPSEEVETALDQSAVLGAPIGRDGEYADGNGTPDASETVDAHDVQGIVDSGPVAHEDDPEVAHYGCDGTYYHGRPRVHISASGRDSDESCEDAGAQTGHVDASDMEILDDEPHDGGHTGRDERVDAGEDGDVVETSGGAAVESEPADPEKEAPDEHQWYVVGPSLGYPVAPLADSDCSGDSRDTGAYVDDGPSGEVDVREPDLRERVYEASAPDHVSHGGVDEYRPQSQEGEDRGIPYPLGGGAEHDACGQYGERALEHHVFIRRDGAVALAHRQAAAEDGVESAHERSVACQCQGVSNSPPDYSGDGHDAQALCHYGGHTLLPQHAAVEQRDRRRHDEDQKRAEQDEHG